MDSKRSPYPNSHPKFSQELQALLEQLAEQPLTLGDILHGTAERGFSLGICLLVLPFLLPMPPGFTTILGPACLLLSLQMTWGRRSPWLPQRVAKLTFPPTLARQILSQLKRVTRFTERFVQPRWRSLAAHRRAWQINGLCISWLTLLLMAPIPMTNPIPTVNILMFAIALLEADGLLMFCSYLATGLITSGFGLLLYGLWRSPDFIMRWIS